MTAIDKDFAEYLAGAAKWLDERAKYLRRQHKEQANIKAEMGRDLDYVELSPKMVEIIADGMEKIAAASKSKRKDKPRRT